MSMINLDVLNLLNFLKEGWLHLYAGLNHCFMYFLKFEKSISVLTSSDKEFQMRGPRIIKLLSPYLTVL